MLNIGFIGGGGIARHHAARLTQIKGARILAVSDVIAAAANSFASDFGAEYHMTDYRRMLDLPDLDAVWVCTPTFQHPAPVIVAAKAGKHVFCEKPMALNLPDARRMLRACEQANVRLTIGFVRRFDSQWGKLKQIVQSGALGRPVIWRFASGGRPGPAWFRDVNKGGGPLIDGAVHNYDFALQIFGPAASAQASSLQFDPTSVGADTASAIINFASGDQHTLIWSWGMAEGTAVDRLNDIIGPKGSLQFGMTAQKAPSSFDQKKHGAFTVKTSKGREKVHTYPLKDMFTEQAKHVVKCFARNEQPLVTGTDGIAALEIATAVLKAGKGQRTIKI